MNPTRSTTQINTQKSCSANGNPGCIRGFVRDRCQKCDLGSIACDMCLPPPSPPPPTLLSPATLFFKQSTSPNNQSQIKNRKLHRVSYSSPSTSPASNAASSKFMQRRSLSFDPTPALVPAPLDRKTRQSISISHSFCTSPTSPTFSNTSNIPSSLILSSPSSTLPPIPSASTCIYCRDGRKPCEDCFGLGYVQRICKDCIRESHRRHNSGSGLSIGIGVITGIGGSGGSGGSGGGGGGGDNGRQKSSMPSTWNQMGDGWTRLKEQLLLSTGPKSSIPDTSDSPVAQSVQGLQQIEEFHPQQSGLKKFEGKKKIVVVVNKLPLVGSREEREDLSFSSPSISTLSQPSPSSAHVRDSNKSSGRISFRATVLKHFKVPPLFSSNNNNNNNSTTANTNSDQTTGRNKHYRRQWSISLFAPSLLRAASTAA